MKTRATAVFFMFVTGCTGATFGEQYAGEDTYLEPGNFVDEDGDGVFHAIGSIGVDPENERSIVAQAKRSEETETRRILSVPPDGVGAIGERDVTHMRDLRILFPGRRGLLMAEEGGVDVINLVDTATLGTIDVIETQGRYHGTRLSPSKERLAVCDNNASPCPIHVIDLATKEIYVLPHGAAWLEAMWLYGSDTLVVSLFYADNEETEDVDEAYTRVTAYPWDDVVASGYAIDPADPDVYVSRTFDVILPGARPDFFFSFTWIGIAPDDGTIALPVRLDQQHVVALIGLDGTVRLVDDARGPVGFTPDGSTVVSYRYVTEPCDAVCQEEEREPEVTPELVLIDVEDLVTTSIPMPTLDAPEYFVTRTGNLVVVADAWNEGRLVIADLTTGLAQPLDGPTVRIRELVSHGDALFIVDAGLFRVDLVESVVTEVDLAFDPTKINLLPVRDRLVVDDGRGTGLVFLDPATGAETGRATF